MLEFVAGVSIGIIGGFSAGALLMHYHAWKRYQRLGKEKESSA